MTTDFDTIIVGAGVIGLAISRQFSMSGQSVLVLEKADRAGTETSSRNSEVIHAGIYYPTGSLKARWCVEGRELLYDFCVSHGVAHKRVGKLIVATTTEEEAKLQSIADLAKVNGVQDIKWLSQSDVASMEQEVRCTSALFSPSTGIVDVQGLMLALQGDAEVYGADFAFNSRFQEARKQGDVFVVTASDIDGNLTQLTSRALINCAGHGAHDVVANIAGYPIDKSPPRYLAKGSYCSVSGKSPFIHLVYPVPVPGGLGIHATLDLAGGLRLGPDVQWVESFNYAVATDLPAKFTSSVSSYWPAVKNRTLTPDYCGIRPKIHGPQVTFDDFMVEGSSDHGVRDLVNLFGIESPGLTASLALARHVQNGLRL